MLVACDSLHVQPCCDCNNECNVNSSWDSHLEADPDAALLQYTQSCPPGSCKVEGSDQLAFQQQSAVQHNVGEEGYCNL